MKKLLIILILFFIPVIAFANAGSPFVWFSIFHLLFINILIGFGEIWIYSFYNLEAKKISLIFSNYLSMFFGYYFIAPYFSKIAGNNDFWRMQMTAGDTYQLKGFLIGFGIAFFATLLIELPLHYYSVYKNIQNSNKYKKDFIVAFLYGNIFTNLIMLLIYLYFVRENSVW